MWTVIINRSLVIAFDTRADAIRAASYLIASNHNIGGSCVVRKARP